MKKVIIGFGVFLGFMVICTLISKSVYAYRLPMVSTCSPEAKYIEHKVEAEGIVVAGGEKTVTYLAGLRIDSVLVHVGEKVEEGDILFQVDLEDLKKLMKEKQTEVNKISLQISGILENQAVEQQKRELELARAREDYDTTSRLQDTQVGRAMENYVQAEKDLEENGGEEELKDALQSAAYGEADAKAARDEAVKQAQRRVEDLLLPEEFTTELENARLEQAVLSHQLQEYQKVLDSQGVVRAPFSGVVTKVAVGAGDRIPDTAVMLLSDESLPCQLKILLDKEQKKYVGLGDQVLINLEEKGSKLEEKVDYLLESESSPETYEALITLPEGIGTPGTSGTIFRSESGEKYGLCIPAASVYSENGRSYVYALKEREGILGQEYYVEEINVRVIDENENWVAIGEGAVDKESRIILSATKEVKKGETVRWEEE